MSQSESVDGVLSPEKSHELDMLQEQAADNAVNFLAVRTSEDPFPLIAMATGIGKGRIIHKIIDREIRRNPGAKVLISAGTKLILVDQTKKALEGYVSEANGKEHEWKESESLDEATEDTEDVAEELDSLESSFLYKTVALNKRQGSDANVHVGTIQSIQSEIKNGTLNPDDYDLIIPDEVHNLGTKARVETLKLFKNAVGFTATPYRHSGVLKVPEQYGFTIIDSLTLPEAQARDFLPPLVETPIKTDHLVEEIPTNLNGDIDYSKLEKLLKESDGLRPFIAEKVLDYIYDGEKKKKAIIVVNFVWEAEEIAKLLNARGVAVGIAVNKRAAKEIHSDEISALDSIKRYKLSQDDPNSLQVLVSPYVAGEGFDAPETEVLVWASPTDSSVRYTQFTGRLSRRSQGKQFGHVIDFLYQTAQYNWSYNFGQWMKDTVIQLPDGRFFQGSESQLKKLQQSTEFKRNDTYRIDYTSLDELTENFSLDPIQEDDAPITSTFLEAHFKGNVSTLLRIARSIPEEIGSENPDLIVRKRNGTRGVLVITDKDLFIKKMLERGAKLKEVTLPLVQEGDYVVTYGYLRDVFLPGQNNQMFGVYREVIQDLQKNNPNSILRKRKANGSVVTVITDKDLFIKKMLEAGARLKNPKIDIIQEGDAVLNQAYLQIHFHGDINRHLRPLAREVIGELKTTHPDLVVKRKSGTKFVDVVTDESLFIKKMIEKGALERIQDLPLIQDDDIVVNNRFLNSNFVGGQKKMRSVMEEVRRKYPELFITKNSNGYHVLVITDLSGLFQRMQEEGVELRDNDLLPPQEDDISLTQQSLRANFNLGRDEKIKKIAQEVFEEIAEQNPNMIARRRNGSHVIDVVVNKDFFLQKMLERGVGLKNPDEIS